MLVPLHSEIGDVHLLLGKSRLTPLFYQKTLKRARMLRTLHSEIRDVHRLATDVEYFFAKLNKLKQVFRARKSDIDYIGVCGNRTLHSEYSPKTI